MMQFPGKHLARGLAVAGLALTLCTALLVNPAMAQVPPPQLPLSEQQRLQIADLTYFLQAYEQRFGAMPPQMRQTMVETASNEIAAGRYEAFIAGFRQAIGVPATFGQRPPGASTGGSLPAPTGGGNGAFPGADSSPPTGGAANAITGMRVFYLQRSPLGYSHGSGYVHFCPGGRFHETSEGTIQHPQDASTGMNAGQWRIENGRNGPVVGIYYRQGPRAGQRIEYTVRQMMEGRWTTTNWRYAVDRQAACR